MNLPFNTTIFPEFENFTKIGNGSFGAVFSATHIKTGLKVAIKMVDKITLLSESTRQLFQREVDINSSMDHPFHAHFYKKVTDQNATYLVMELANSGSVLDYLRAKGKLKDIEVQRIICELLSVVKYIHKVKHYVHRDLKLENMLLDETGNIRVIDFGLCGEITEKSPMLHDLCGSFMYTAPEILKRKPYTYPVDIWSVGVNMYALATGQMPFAGENGQQLQNCITKSEPDFPVGIPKDCVDFIRKLLIKDPSERPDVDELADHPYMKNGRYSFYLSDEFLNSSKYKIRPETESDVDQDVVSRMQKLGISCDTLAADLLARNDTDSTLCYLIMKKQRVIQLINSPEEIRSMYRRRAGDMASSLRQSLMIITPEPKTKSNLRHSPTIHRASVEIFSRRNKTLLHPNILPPMVKSKIGKK